MSLFLQEIDPVVKDTLNLRKELNNSSMKEWNAQKVPFIRVTSLAKGYKTQYQPNNTINQPDNNPTKIYNTTWQDHITKNESANVGTVLDSSFVYPGTQGKFTRKDYVLMGLPLQNGLPRQGYVNTYDVELTKPKPGVTSLSISTAGAYGSLREATVKFKVFTKKDLEACEILFMSLGISCLVEWGWSNGIEKYVDGGKVKYRTIDIASKFNLSNTQLTSNVKNDDEILKDILDAQKQSKGYYNAIQGIISNFSWKYNTDGSYDCETKITSRSNLFLAMSVKKSDNKYTMTIGEKDLKMSDFDVVIYQEIINYFSANKNKNVLRKNSLFFINPEYPGTSSIKYLVSKNKPMGQLIAYDRTKGTGRETDFAKYLYDSKSGEELDVSDNAVLYITWEFIETYILNQLCGFRNEGNNKVMTDKGVPNIAPYFNSYDTYLNTRRLSNSLGEQYYSVFSTNPKICILPGCDLKYIAKQIDANNANYSGGSTGGTTYSTILAAVQLNKQYKINEELIKDSIIIDKDGIPKYTLRSILFNMKFVYEQYKRYNNSVTDFVMALLNGVSDTCGNIWKFQIVEDLQEQPDKINGKIAYKKRLRVIDENTISTSKSAKNFEVFNITVNKDSIVKDIQISTEVDSKLKTQIVYSTQRNKNNSTVTPPKNPAYTFFGQNVTNAYNVALEYPKIDVDSESIRSNKIKTIQLETDADFYKMISDSLFDLNNEVSEETIRKAETALQQYIEYYPSRTHYMASSFRNIPSDKQTIILPLSLGVKFEGISGFRYGDACSIDSEILPQRYRTSVQGQATTLFIVTGISDEITNTSWDTQLKMQMRVNVNTANIISQM